MIRPGRKKMKRGFFPRDVIVGCRHGYSRFPSERKRRGVFDIGPACEEAFCRVIAQRTGIVLHDHQLPNLRDTIRQGCRRFGFSGCIQFLQSLEASHGPTAELEFLIAGVTVGESYFFRDSEQIALLRDSLLPQLIAAKREAGDLSLRIWSAGCSMGQEIYTIALLLHELIPDISSWRLHLLGTDINTGSVSSAIHGRYSEWSFRATPPALRERWFTRVGAEYDLRPEVRQMVKFSYLNLTADVFPSILGETNALDIILCRNVFIYLDREVIRRIMAQFAECLNTDGVLMMGASDPVDMQCAGLEWQHDGQAAYFRKRAITAARERRRWFLLYRCRQQLCRRSAEQLRTTRGRSCRNPDIRRARARWC